VALLLALNRRLLAYHEQVQTHLDWRWNEVRGVQRLAGRTLGLIGFGRIGQAVCRRARAFGLEVLASDPQIDEQTARRHDARLCDVDELLAASHIVSLHCNLHAGNVGLLNRDAFARMRQRPLLINVARGALIVEADLVRALDQAQVSGAALDVLAQESPDLAHHPLAGRADVLLTPHVAFYSEASLEDLRRISAQNIRAYLQGKPAEVFRLVSAAEIAA
jgi:D-3-phosphoglycerate dehydrogenase